MASAVVSCHFGCGHSTTGFGETRQEALQDASRQMASHLMNCPNDPNK